MSQCAGTDFRTELHRRASTALRFRSQLGRDKLEHNLLDELPMPSTHADADVAKVTINRAEIRVLRGIRTNPRVSRGSFESDYRRVRLGTL